MHRTNRYEPAEIWSVDGMRVASVARTCLDICAVLPFALTSPAIEHAVITKKVTLGALIALLERIGGRGVRGTADLRVAVRTGRSDAMLQSMLERVVARALDELPIRSRRPPAPVDVHRRPPCRARLRLARADPGPQPIQRTDWVHLSYGGTTRRRWARRSCRPTASCRSASRR
ncbi:MAG TPA: hypothetical protein VEA78_07875 [Acidimicrobiales bacterium]|nr:hypothetical protein [Acidimicrobiales bacterium]